jgi:hypothetical protein
MNTIALVVGGVVLLLCYIAPVAIGAAIGSGSSTKNDAPWLASVLVVANAVAFVLSKQSFVGQLIGDQLAPWAWVPAAVGLILGMLFGALTNDTSPKDRSGRPY